MWWRFWRWPLGVRALGLGLAIAAAFALSAQQGQRTWLLPGATSDGHHVIEDACENCHTGFEPPGNERCTGCHDHELRNDTHPVQTFEDPRWASERDQVDARRCASCHGEHARNPRGVSAERELCVLCHDDVLHKRASHRGFSRGSCMDGGCHNYHDNGALSSAFLRDQLAHPPPLQRRFPLDYRDSGALAATRMVPGALAADRDQAIAWRWEHSTHARNDVGCERCHGSGAQHMARPDERACERCHGFEVDGFRRGKHGARRAAGLPPLRVERARLPMRAQARHAELGCASCHDAHALDVSAAATSACLGCHADDHTRAFASSPHAKSEVTCATCHLPRVEVPAPGGATRVAVVHDNSFTRAPRDRMAAIVCSKCHDIGLAFAALYDEASVRSNFARAPASTHRSIEMARMAADE